MATEHDDTDLSFDFAAMEVSPPTRRPSASTDRLPRRIPPRMLSSTGLEARIDPAMQTTIEIDTQTPAKLLPYHEFRRQHPATRCFYKYSGEQRSGQAASHRLTNRQRESTGEFYYVHPMVPDRAFPTAKEATLRAYDVYLGPEPHVLHTAAGAP